MTDTIGVVGSFIGGRGTVTVSGTGSLWDNSGELIVGNGFENNPATGELTISLGGEVKASQVTVAAAPGSQGTINIGAPAGSPVFKGPRK